MTQYLGVYSVLVEQQAFTAARTICQVNAGSDQPFEIIRAYLTFSSTTSTSIEVALKQVSTAGTGSPFTAEPHREGVAFGGSMSTNHTAEGTLVDHLMREYVNYLQGFRYLPVPEERFRAVGGERIAMEFPTAPGASITVSGGIVIGLL